jgi:protein TonB
MSTSGPVERVHRRAHAAHAHAPVPSPLDQASDTRSTGSLIALSGAALMHAGVGLAALWLAGLPEVERAIKVASTQMFEVAVEPDPPAPKEPEPEPPASTPTRVRAVKEPAQEAAPAAAQAAQVVTQAPEPEVVDFGDSFVQGTASEYAGGVTEATGTAKHAVRDARAGAGGLEGGQGTDTSSVDRSRAPSLAGGAQWDCPFPEEADDDGVDKSTVTLRVKVKADGNVESVDVEQAEQRGFGREARRCAMRKRWQPGLDRTGKASTMTTVVKVRFTR